MTLAFDEITPHEMPLPNGIDWATGRPLAPVDSRALDGIDEDPASVRKRLQGQDDFLVSLEIENPNDLSQAGWGVIFGSNTSVAVKRELQPLLDHRARMASPFSVFEGLKGVTPGETAFNWLEKQGVTLSTVNPSGGVPFYLLIVASPQDVPFEFQYLLDSYWAVGRLHFDTAEEYGRYAARVVEYETAPPVRHSKTVAVFAPRNDGDRATAFLFHQLARPLVEGTPGPGGFSPIGERQGFRLRSAIGEHATKDALCSMLRGEGPGGRPALLFTGSHGAYADRAVARRLDRIGAIVTQDWGGPGSPLEDACCYGSTDLERDAADLYGLIHFFFACYSAGCPEFDTYARNSDGTRIRLLEETLVSRLPQQMLEHGALAVLGHMDRAFACSFQTSRLTPQIQDMRDVLAAILKGWRIGRATDQFNMRWTVLSAELSDALRDRQSGLGALTGAALANRWIARDDARNYIILGDPAVRLRVEDLS